MKFYFLFDLQPTMVLNAILICCEYFIVLRDWSLQSSMIAEGHKIVIMKQILNLNKVIVHTIRPSVFTAKTLVATIDGFSSISSGSTHWERLDTGSLSLFFLLVLLLSSRTNSISSQMVLGSRAPVFCAVTSNLLSSVYPLHSGNCFYYIEIVEQNKLLNQLLEEVKAMTSVSSYGPLTNKTAFTQWHFKTVALLESLIASSSNETLFCSTLVDALLRINPLFDGSARTWANLQEHIIGSSNASGRPLGIRKLYPMGANKIGVSGSDAPSELAIMLFRLFVSEVSINTEGSTYNVCTPTMLDGIAYVVDTDLQGQYMDLLGILKLDSNVQSETSGKKIGDAQNGDSKQGGSGGGIRKVVNPKLTKGKSKPKGKAFVGKSKSSSVGEIIAE
jgi:hypothetical protein